MSRSSKQSKNDLRDPRGGAFDGKPPKQPSTPDKPGPSEQFDQNTPEGLQRERKGPLGPKTGRG